MTIFLPGRHSRRTNAQKICDFKDFSRSKNDLKGPAKNHIVKLKAYGHRDHSFQIDAAKIADFNDFRTSKNELKGPARNQIVELKAYDHSDNSHQNGPARIAKVVSRVLELIGEL